MARPTPLRIDVLDLNDAPAAVDKVRVALRADPTERVAPPYEFQLNDVGEGEITLEKAGHHTYRFGMEVVESKEDLTLRFVKNAQMTDLPMMASLVKLSARQTGKSAGLNHLTIRIGACREILLVCGYDYHGGSKERAFGVTRMHDLRKERLIDPSTVITFFEFETGRKTRWVEGRGKERHSDYLWTSGWYLLSDEKIGTTPILDQGDPNYPGKDAISITHIYSYIQEVGELRPGSLSEFSVFSHSSALGPIMFNTFERDEYKTLGARLLERDPLDHDARGWKDFGYRNMDDDDRRRFAAAFSADPLLKIWGCLATRSVRKLVNKVRTAPNDLSPLGIPPAERRELIRGGKIYNDNRVGMIDYFKDIVYESNYLYDLSKAAGHPVWGAPPGLGSLNLRSGGMWWWHYVPEYKLVIRNGMRERAPGAPPYYQKELRFMQDRMGWVFSSDWYMRYEA